MKENAQKAHALTKNGCCGKVMQNGIEEQSDFETAVRNEPVKLLRIKRSMHMPTRQKCKCEGLLEMVKCFVVDTKQEENEDLTAHTERLKQCVCTVSGRRLVK